MPEDHIWERDSDALLEELSDALDSMSEEDLDLSAVDACLSALDEREGGASWFNAEEAERSFREKHRDLIRGDGEARPALKGIPGGRGRRPGGLRLAGRVAAVAAATALCCVLVCQAAGIDVFGFLAHWGREEFTFSSAGEPVEDTLVYGSYRTLTAALEANGISTPIAPVWTPGPGGSFGKLNVKVKLSRETQSDLFTADYRAGDGRGYTVNIRRSDFSAPYSTACAGPGSVIYVCDGRYYAIVGYSDGTMGMFWSYGNLAADAKGDLDLETAMHLARSVTRENGRTYTAPDPDRTPPLGNDMQSLLSVWNLDPNLAPTWLPEGFTKSEITSSMGRGATGRVEGIHAVFDDAANEKSLTVDIEWWDEEGDIITPIFERDGKAETEYIHDGVTYRILDDGGAHIVAWTAGHVSGYISGDITMEEAKAVIDSIPRWSEERPEPDNTGVVSVEPKETRFPTMAQALAANGLSEGLAPGWVPERYVLHEVVARELSIFTSIDATYEDGDLLLQMSIKQYEDQDAAEGGTWVIMKDENPVVEVRRGGVTYFIMTNGDYRSIAWKTGLLEGFISGTFTEDEARKMIDSMGE